MLYRIWLPVPTNRATPYSSIRRKPANVAIFVQIYGSSYIRSKS